MDYQLYHQRRMPHYQPQHGILFVTFRLNFSIPTRLIQSYCCYAETLKIRFELGESNTEQKTAHQKLLFAYNDELYNHVSWNISLTEPATVAEIMRDVILSLHGDLYRLYASTIMPNHVHIVIKPLEIDGKAISISEIMRKIKGVSARQINSHLHREGSLWYREYYDHCIRNTQEFVNVIEYVRNNPVKAGLVTEPELWKWTWINHDLIEDVFK